MPEIAEPWTAIDINRSDPPRTAGERAALEGWLDYHRQTLLTKCAGLSAEQLCQRAVPPSNLSLLGLVRHMAEVERWWFRICVDGQQLDEIFCTPERPNDDFDAADPAGAEQDMETLRSEIVLARAAAAPHGLDETFKGRTQPIDIRWTYLHMIEEYARHNGHADLLRECIDGVTGE